MRMKINWAMPFKRYCLLLALMVISCAYVSAQRTITGTLTDAASGEPLIGASVVIQGTSTGTITDIDGNYAVEANTNDVLLFSYVGYTDMTKSVGEGNLLNVDMSQGVMVDEVVVTGYQSQRKRDITGAVSVIESKSLNEISAPSVGQKLAGRAPGLNISTSGVPGAGTAINIRGFNSLSSNNPLVVIDGVPTKDVFLNSINPNDIESIQVLKDAASASVYGARGSNGVIVVTTKKGKSGETKVGYNAYVGQQSAVNRLDLATADQFFGYVKEAASTIEEGSPYFGSSYPEFYFGDPSQPYDFTIDPATNNPANALMRSNTGEGTDWWSEVFRTAPIMEHNLNVSGGGENNTFSVTGNYFNQEGIMVHSFFERFSLRANTSFKIGKLTIGENLSVSRINQVGAADGNQSEQNAVTNIIRIQPFIPVYDESGVNFAGPKGSLAGLGNNPVKKQFEDKDDVQTYNRLFGNFYGQFELMEGLSVRSSLGFDRSDGFSQNATFPNYEAREITQRIFNYSENWNSGFAWTWTNTLNLVRTFNDVHAFNAVAGYEAFKETGRNIGGGLANYFVFGLDSRYLNTGLADPESRGVGSGGFGAAYNSVFAKVDYAFDDFVLLSASVRRDASSKFGPESRVGVFPAFSVGLRLTELVNADIFDDLKVRFSYGISGNDDISSTNQFPLFGGGTNSTFYGIGGVNNSIQTGYALTNRGNAAGKWEELEQMNLGFDATMMNGKLNVVLDLYNKTTKDLLFQAAIPATAGSAAPAFQNIAEMANTGFDASINYRDNINSNIGFNVGLVLGSYNNEITKVSDDQTEFFANTSTRIGAITINRVGAPLGAFYGYETDGLFQSQAEVDAHAEQLGKYVGGIRFKDINEDGAINGDDRKIIGNFHPDLTAGLNLGVNFGDFDVSAFIFGSFGNQAFNFNKLFHDFSQFEANVTEEVATNFWSTSNTSSNIPAPSFNGRVNNAPPSDYYVEDASYVRLNSFTVGYRLPETLGFLSNARVYLQTQNALTFTGYSGVDPAFSNFGRSVTESGVDFGNYPTAKIMKIGLDLNF